MSIISNLSGLAVNMGSWIYVSLDMRSLRDVALVLMQGVLLHLTPMDSKSTPPLISKILLTAKSLSSHLGLQ